MLIGDRYADNKMYRGIKHYDSLPLTSGDIHEYTDTVQMKNSYIMNNLLGSGILNNISFSLSSTGVSLTSPAVLLIDGDVALIQSNSDILKTTDIESSGIGDGVLCIVGWYQSITASSTLREYGGVRNSVLENDLLDPKFKVQISTRYQFRWDTVILDRSQFYNSDNINFNLINRDATGNTTSGVTSITTKSRVGDIRIATKPTSMDYAVSDLYIVPLLNYTYTSSNFTEVKSVKALKPTGALGDMIKSSTTPTGSIEEGTIWYDTSNSSFNIYLEGIGFVPTANNTSLMQYSNTITISTATETATNILLDIGIEQYDENDILQVVYNGVVLTEGLHYTLHKSDKNIHLLGFTTRVGDQVTFIDTKLIATDNISSIASDFNTHVNSTGNASIKGHVSLSDNASSTLGASSGVAVTPKALYESTILTDSVTNKKYKLVVTNGVLGIEAIV